MLYKILGATGDDGDAKGVLPVELLGEVGREVGQLADGQTLGQPRDFSNAPVQRRRRGCRQRKDLGRLM
jgi:hypothetical protein